MGKYIEECGNSLFYYVNGLPVSEEDFFQSHEQPGPGTTKLLGELGLDTEPIVELVEGEK